MYRIKKEICCVIVLAILGSMPVNAKEVLQNENVASLAQRARSIPGYRGKAPQEPSFFCKL